MKTKSTKLISVCFIFAFGLFFLRGPSAVQAEDVIVPLHMSPFKVVLNAKGNSEDFQAVLSMPLASGYHLADFDVALYFEGVEVARAVTFRYCYIDANFLAGFDRTEVLLSPIVQSFAGEVVPVSVEGWFSAESSDGGFYTQSFLGESFLEIFAPGAR